MGVIIVLNSALDTPVAFQSEREKFNDHLGNKSKEGKFRKKNKSSKLSICHNRCRWCQKISSHSKFLSPLSNTTLTVGVELTPSAWKSRRPQPSGTLTLLAYHCWVKTGWSNSVVNKSEWPDNMKVSSLRWYNLVWGGISFVAYLGCHCYKSKQIQNGT